MKPHTTKFREKLEGLGLTREAIDAVWPGWWSDEAEGSVSAQAELKFTVARRLGLLPNSVLGENQPEFVWKHNAKFKGFSKYGGSEQSALTSFGIALGRTLDRGVDRANSLLEALPDANALRNAILQRSQFVSLQDICAASWGLGIPVVHLRVFPLSAKHMVAMAVRTPQGFAILVGKDSKFPAPTAYHVAHELGHITAGHLVNTDAIIDLEEAIEQRTRDQEEAEADEFALEVLTGQRRPLLQFDVAPNNGLELANAVNDAAAERRVEPGTLALCYGHQTSDWKSAYAALNHIYDNTADVWRFLNLTAMKQLDWTAYKSDEAAYLRAVLGAVSRA